MTSGDSVKLISSIRNVDYQDDFINHNNHKGKINGKISIKLYHQNTRLVNKFVER
jgi:hypothetical protein